MDILKMFPYICNKKIKQLNIMKKHFILTIGSACEGLDSSYVFLSLDRSKIDEILSMRDTIKEITTMTKNELHSLRLHCDDFVTTDLSYNKLKDVETSEVQYNYEVNGQVFNEKLNSCIETSVDNKLIVFTEHGFYFTFEDNGGHYQFTYLITYETIDYTMVTKDGDMREKIELDIKGNTIYCVACYDADNDDSFIEVRDENYELLGEVENYDLPDETHQPSVDEFKERIENFLNSIRFL